MSDSMYSRVSRSHVRQNVEGNERAAFSRTQLRARHGATMLETVIVLSLLILLGFGLLDLGFALFRHHTLSNAAHQLGRQAIVHGALADQLGAWGPDAVSTTAGTTEVEGEAETWESIRETVRNSVAGINPDEVQIDLQWPDAGNDPREGHRVQVSVKTPFRPISTFLFGNPAFDLKASTTMHIAH